MADSEDKWEHLKTLVDGERFEINGCNIWESEWKDTGEQIRIKDPLYGRVFTFTVYQIINEQTTVKFAAGEFSNCVWGIYLKKD
jgi:hypothetical protein